MKRCSFKDAYVIRRRDNPPEKNNYNDYLAELDEDFKGRCGYCNSSSNLVTIEIDHFVPKSLAPHLENEYSNLVFSCKQCNRAKSNKCSPIVGNNYVNSYFYDPATTDYNTIFYRNEYGYIFSDDELGNEMIKRLKLYRATYSMTWMIDKLGEFILTVESRLNSGIDAGSDIYRLLYKVSKLKDEFRNILQRSLNGLMKVPERKQDNE